MSEIAPLQWTGKDLRILDQTKLPQEELVVTADTYADVINAIKTMQVRGAPALGVAGAYAMVLACRSLDTSNIHEIQARLQQVGEYVANARPTAVNLAWSVQRMMKVVLSTQTDVELGQRLEAEANKLYDEDVAANRRIGLLGSDLIPEKATVLTHCNTGALATAGYGTALGVIRAAWESGRQLNVIATETRPFLQGARLTAWELVQLGIPTDLIVDSAVGSVISRGQVNCVVVGADRIAANGDTANKIGTYNIAVIAHENGVPFYVAAPTSTLDLTLPSGSDIPIEERDGSEIVNWGDTRVAAEGIGVQNPAFDVTPARYITAIITEQGIATAPFTESLHRLLKERLSNPQSNMTVPMGADSHRQGASTDG